MTTGHRASAGMRGRRRVCAVMIMNSGLPFLGLLLFAVSCQSPRQGDTAREGALYPEEILSAVERRQEIVEKERRVLEWLRREKLSAVLLSSPSNFAWITGGGSGRPDLASPWSAPLLIRADGRKFIFDRGGQAGPIPAGEMQSFGYEVRRAAWFDRQFGSEPTAETLRDLAEGHPYASDEPSADARLARDEIAALHVPLTEWEVRKYRWLGRNCAGAVDSVCRRIERWWTDQGIETMLYRELAQRAIRPLEVHVEADTDVPGTATRKVADYALVSVSASRWGLVVVMKRAVHFGPLPPALRQSEEAAARVEAGLWARTAPGMTGRTILEGLVADYAEAGFPEGWRQGPPGGRIGYAPLDSAAIPASQDHVREFEAFAWNAAIGDFAMEDTILLDGDRLVILTEIPGWPVIESRALGRIYRLPAILQRNR